MTVLPQNANRANATHDPGIKPRVVYQLDELVRADRRFSTIYADPPWAYRNRSSRAAAINHYATLSVNEICALPVAQLAAANAHLHLWSTVPLLEDTLIVLRAWGFSYKPCFVWVKEQLDMGNYWRVSHELLLLGVRGRRPFRRPRTRSWLRCRRSIHSRKSLIA